MSLLGTNRILLIEDDIDICEALLALLEDEGYHGESASNGLVALNLLASSVALPNVILLDLMMPIMDGRQFFKNKLLEPRLMRIPTIIMSANTSRLENDTDLSSAVAFLKKPIDFDLLLETLRVASTSL